MKRTLQFIITIVGTVLCCHNGFCQKVLVAFTTEYGSYAMGSLDGLQEELKKQLPVPSKNVSSFPSYWGYSGKFYYMLGRFQFGLTGGVNSTGGRTSYRDYSGSIQFDQLAKLTHFGVGCNLRLTQKDKPWEFFVSAQTEGSQTKYALSSVLVLGDEMVEEETLDFKARGILFHPSLILSRTLVKRLFISAQAGFVLESSSQLLYTKDKDLYLLDKDNEPIAPNWSGYRLGVSVGVKL
jgi:hypothetical protein